MSKIQGNNFVFIENKLFYSMKNCPPISNQEIKSSHWFLSSLFLSLSCL